MPFLKRSLTFLLACTFASIFAQEKPAEGFSFIAIGDMPYFLPQDYSKFEKVIQTINLEKPAFSIHVGDFKSSSTPCSDTAFQKIYGYFNQFEQPLIYVPGDNEWTDCFKKEAGSFDPEERLNVIRKLFFKDTFSFGKNKLTLISQSQNIQYKKFVENKRWNYGKIAFATIHVVGTNNNFIPTSNNGNKEFYEREQADLVWLENAFQEAKAQHQKALVLIIHADMFFDKKNTDDIGSGFNKIKQRLKELTIDFKKPVLLIHGDSHELIIDKPFFENGTEKHLVNFTRIQVHGDHDMHGVKISINYNSPAIFQFEEFLVDTSE
jgi:hypothetical protein